jgi:putative FmdB family regulatory protein
MPTYEYQCKDCRKEFSIMQSMTEHARGGTRCPQCGSEQLVQKISVFTVQTSKKS